MAQRKRWVIQAPYNGDPLIELESLKKNFGFQERVSFNPLFEKFHKKNWFSLESNAFYFLCCYNTGNGITKNGLLKKLAKKQVEVISFKDFLRSEHKKEDLKKAWSLYDKLKKKLIYQKKMVKEAVIKACMVDSIVKQKDDALQNVRETMEKARETVEKRRKTEAEGYEKRILTLEEYYKGLLKENDTKMNDVRRRMEADYVSHEKIKVELEARLVEDAKENLHKLHELSLSLEKEKQDIQDIQDVRDQDKMSLLHKLNFYFPPLKRHGDGSFVYDETNEKNALRILNTEKCDNENIKSAFKKIIKHFHPDKSGLSVTETHAIRICEARDYLMKKRHY